MPMVLFVFSLRTPRRRANKEKKKAGHALTHAYRASFLISPVVRLSVGCLHGGLSRLSLHFSPAPKKETQRPGTGGKERGIYRNRVEIQKYTNIHHTGVARSGSSIHSILYKTKFNIIATRRNFFPSALRERSGPSSERERGS